jgi:lysophospholipase L1-like esterase
MIVRKHLEIKDDPTPMIIWNAIQGREIDHTDYWTMRLSNIEARVDVDKIMVSLGINDATNLTPAATLEAGIDAIMMATDADVFWVLPFTTRTDKPHLAVVRAELFAAAGRWPKLTLVDFETHVAGQGLLIDDMLLDGIHLSNQGASVYGQMLQAL